MRQDIEMLLPKSEQTIIKHNFDYKGLKYINDLGHPCEYRIEQNGKDTNIMAKYYCGRLLATYILEDVKSA